MRVLGLNLTHDAGLCIINDGHIELFLKEERLCGIKRDVVPLLSFLSELDNINSVDDVILCGLSQGSTAISNEIFVHLLNKYKFKKDVRHYYNEHHLCHASNAFYNSGFENALIFVIDGAGSSFGGIFRECESVFTGSYPANFNILHKNFFTENKYQRHEIEQARKFLPFFHNVDAYTGIVGVYCSATNLIGQDVMENGKTMGLSSYGRDLPFEDLFINGRPKRDLFTLDGPPHYKKFQSKTIQNVTEDNYQFYADFAYQVQKQTQQQALELVSGWVKKTGIKNVCMSGGYAMNVVCNEYLIKNLPEVNFFFDPLADDTGTAIGAAMLSYRVKTQDPTIIKQKHTFFSGRPQKLETVGSPCSTDDVVRLLMEQKTVAVFNGLAEAGPRALGNRSILFDARNPNGKDIVNRIKRREWYRPFAAMILEDDFEEYFETLGIKKSEFMTVSFHCKKPELIPAVIHVDNTCRIQTIDKSIPHVYNMLSLFKEKTGCPVILNTSFNMAGDPLIETQEQAIDCFNNTEIDALWFPEIERMLLK